MLRRFHSFSVLGTLVCSAVWCGAWVYTVFQQSYQPCLVFGFPFLMSSLWAKFGPTDCTWAGREQIQEAESLTRVIVSTRPGISETTSLRTSTETFKMDAIQTPQKGVCTHVCGDRGSRRWVCLLYKENLCSPEPLLPRQLSCTPRWIESWIVKGPERDPGFANFGWFLILLPCLKGLYRGCLHVFWGFLVGKS